MANQSDNVSYQAYEAWRKKKQQKSMKTTGYQKWKAERDSQASSGETENYQAWKRKQVEELIASKPERRKEIEARQEEARRQREAQRKQETISQIRQRVETAQQQARTERNNPNSQREDILHQMEQRKMGALMERKAQKRSENAARWQQNQIQRNQAAREYEDRLASFLENADRELAVMENALVEYRDRSRWEQDEKGAQRLEELRRTYGSIEDLESLISSRKLTRESAAQERKRQEQAGITNPYSKYYDPDFRTRAAQGINAYEKDRAARAQEQEIQNQLSDQALKDPSIMDMAGANTRTTVLHEAERYRRDESYKQPDERWSDEQRVMFGYLYSRDPDEASDYAIGVNNQLDQKEKQMHQKAIQKDVTRDTGPVSNALRGAANMGAAVISSIAGRGEGLNQIPAEMMGRGILTERGGMLSPREYSAAITGSIGEDLNKKYGTLDDDIPVFGGKGWGDVYQLGTSTLESIASAFTMGSTGTMVGYFGQAMASGVDDAKSRGASDEQALLYGLLSGAAEGLAEKSGVDNLLKMGKAETMRQLLGNVVKQGLSEGAEEGITSVLDNLADRLVMQDRSIFNLTVHALIQDGVSPAEARAEAWKQMVEDTAWDMVGGFVSGSASGGLTTGLQNGLDWVGGQRGQAQIAHEFQEQEDIEAESGENTELEVFEEFQDLHLRDEESRMLMKNFQASGMDRADYSIGVRTAFQYGELGIPERELSRPESRASVLPEGYRHTAYQIGKLHGDEKTAREQAAVKGKTAPDQLKAASEKYGAQAGAMIHTYKQGQDVAQYDAAYQMAYNMGKEGVKLDYVKKAESIAYLTERQKEFAWEAGQAAAKGKTAPAQLTSAQYDGDWNKLNDAQTAGIYAVNALGETLGIRYRFYESYQKGNQRMYLDENGVEKTAPNGFYKDGVIHLDVNAGSDGQGTVLFTAAHEMTHFIREWSPEKFRVLADTLMEGYAGTDTSVEQLISEKMAAYQKSGESLSFEQAFEEVVADSMETMLADGSFAERVQKLKQTDRTLWEKIRDWFVSMAEGIRKAYEGLKPDSREGQLVAEMVDTAEKLKELFAEAAVDAAGNLSGAEKNTAGMGGEVKYQIREIGNTGMRYVQADRQVLSGDDPAVWGRQIEAYINDIIRKDQDIAIPTQDGHILLLTSRSAYKLKDPHVASIQKKVESLLGNESYALKGRAATHIDELIHVARFRKHQADWNQKHANDIGEDGFNYFDANFQDFDGQYYRIGFSAGVNAAEETVYSIGRIEKRRFPAGSGSSSESEALNESRKSSGNIIYASGSESQAVKSAVELAFEKAMQKKNKKTDVQENGTKFSLRTPVEQTKTLVAMHNLTADKLMKAIDLGGFPMPSIAVTRTDIPHTNFGEITLVMDKSTVDPKANRKNTVYSADAWTPTFPRVEYEADTAVDDRVRQTLSRYESRIAPQFQTDLRKIKYGLEDLLNSQGGEQELVRHVMDNYGLKATYLESQGKHVAEVQVEQEIPKKYSEAAIEKYESMIAVLGTRDPAELGTMPLKDIRDNFGPELEKIVPGISKTGMRLGRFIGQVVDYLMDDGSGPSTETVTDYAATRKAVDDALDNAGYESWVRELYAGIEKDKGIHNGKDRFTPSGRSRSFQQTHLSVTLDNIAKAMAAQNGGNTKNVAGFNGIKTLRAGTAERFKSIQAMHDREGRLKNLSQEEQDALTDELNSRLYDLIDEIDRETGKVGGSNNLMRFDLIGQILMEACDMGSYNVADVQKVFRENHHEIGDGTALKVKELLFDVSQMPVNLFEAKPERAVRFDEVLAAVVPENAGEDLKVALAKIGVPVIEYAEGNVQDRMRKVNSVEGARFSLRDPEHQAVQETLKQENEKLRKDVANLKELVKLQRTVTNGTKFTKTSVEAAAGLLMEKAGVSRGKQELAPILEKFYAFIARNDGYDWSDVAAETQEAVDWLLEHRKPFDLRNGYLYEKDLVRQELMIEVYDSYWRISGLKVPPAKTREEHGRLKYGHYKQMEELRKLHKENAARLSAEHRKAVEQVRTNRQAKERETVQKLMDRSKRPGNSTAASTGFSESDRAIMKAAADGNTLQGLTEAEKAALQIYSRRSTELEKRAAQKSEEYQILSAPDDGKKETRKKVIAARNRASTLEKMIKRLSGELTELEKLPIFQQLLEKARASAAVDAGPDSAVTDTAENTLVPNADDSTGAAPSGFDPISHLQYEYGSIPEGENAVRPDDLPVSTDGVNRVSRTARTVKGAAATPDEFADLIDKEVIRNGLTYIPVSNNEVTQKAVSRITDQGWTEARLQWHADVRAGKTGADMTAMGALLLNNAAKAGDKTAWLNILHDYQIMGTNTAQGLQALRILKTLQPNDSLYMIKRSINRMVEDMHLDTEITLDEELMEAYRAAGSDQARNEAMDKIIKSVAAQIPATSLEKWTALRYVNMLGNFRTQVRNITGNLGMKAVVSAKNAVASGLEQIAHAASGGRYEKTKSFLVDRDALKAAKADFEQVSSVILDGGKYADSMQGSAAFANAVQAERRIFKNKALEGYRRVTNWSMEQGDLVFSRSAYARALAEYLKAHGIKGSDFAQVDSNLMDQARLYAIQEAQEATFRDTNWLSGWLSKIGRRPDTPAVGKILSEGIMPFRKTPANVLIRAEEYSPLGMINSVYTSIQAMKKGSDVTGSQVINSWAKTLTGTGLFVLGMTLQNLGLLVGGDDEDESLDKFESLNGWQNYALVLPDGTNLTIDFLSPAAMPMFMGAQLNKMRQDGGIELKELEGAITSLADPMIQMSMLQGVNDTLENIQYAEDNLGQLLINSCLSYLTQGMTNTLLGQLERSGEDQRMTTFVDKDSAVPNWLQRTLGKASAKTPGWDYNQIPYINAWGEEEDYPGHALNAAYNLLSPSYIDKGTEDTVSRELIRLNEIQSDINVFPQTPDKTITYEDKSGITHEDYNLSAEEYVALAKAQGQTQRKLIEGILASGDYAALSDEDKAKAIQYAYKYARESARIEVIPDYSGFSSKWMAEIKGDVAEAIVRKVATGTTDKYTSLSVSTAAHVTELLEGITPEAGHSGVRDIQKLEAVMADRKMTSNEKESVLKDIMGDSLEGKWNDAKKLGISSDAFVKAYRKYLDTSGKGKKQTVIRYLTGTLRMTEKKAAELYKIFSGAK